MSTHDVPDELSGRLHRAFDPLLRSGAEEDVMQRWQSQIAAPQRATRLTRLWPVHSRFGTALAAVGVVAVAGAALAIAVGLRNHGAPAPAKPTLHVTPPPVVTTQTPAPTPTTAPVQGFDPASFTAIDTSHFWVLGSIGMCEPCTPVIEATSDGGTHFSQIPAPATRYAPHYQTAITDISSIRFANADDGWAFGPGLWATHDGGAHWKSLDLHGKIDSLEAGAGNRVYAIVDECAGRATCTIRLAGADSGGDSWRDLLRTQGPAANNALAVHGTDVWFMEGADLWRSTDSGATFTKLASPCTAELGGSLSAASADVLWAFCATGTSGGAEVSNDGGRTFRGVSRPESGFSNNATVAALSALRVFVDDHVILNMTSNGGGTFSSVQAFGDGTPDWVGFTTPDVGYVVVITADRRASQLWRTSDSGASWQQISFN